MFTLRYVNISAIRSCDQLNKEIKFQLSDDIKREFDVGFVGFVQVSISGIRMTSLRCGTALTKAM
jgi:hypothetical protein